MSWSAVRRLFFGLATCGAAAGASGLPVSLPSVARAQDDGLSRASGPTFQWAVQPLSLAVGQDAVLVIELIVPEGVSVHGYDIDLVVKDADGLVLGAMLLPVAEPVAEADDAMDARYSGRVAIKLPVSTKGATPGLHAITLEGEVRGCAARRCLGATRTEIEALVQVSEPRG